jgi:hypothetical protein
MESHTAAAVMMTAEVRTTATVAMTVVMVVTMARTMAE